MRALLILVCVCACAHAQFSNSFGTPRQTFGQTQTQGFGSQTQGLGSQNQGFRSRSQGFGNQNQGFRSQTQGIGSQTSRPSYNQPQSAFTSQPQPKQSAGACREANERYPVSGSCDRYVECINGTSEEKLCPDGLRFNPNANFNVYPCQYPNEVACLERSALQPPQPTEDCPNQFAYVKLGDAKNCSGFRNCVNGIAFDFVCPEGLAFSSESYRCEWPDQVADCDAEAFLGFRCPAVPTTKELGEPAGYRFYRSDTDCQKFFLCIEGRPRALSCGGDNAFDELTSTCVLADEISACPNELRSAAARSREEEKQRLAQEEQLRSKNLPKRRF